MKRLYTLLLTLLTVSFAWSQTSTVGPNCRALNAHVNAMGIAQVTMSEMVSNYTVAFPAELTITTKSGAVVHPTQLVAAGTTIFLDACPFLHQELKATFRTQGGSCWSALTFKQSNVPQLMGRSKDVYCFDPLVQEGTHIDGTVPTAAIPCGEVVEATFAADWVVAHNCNATPLDPANDTSKVIYREYEAFDKNGNRGSVFDTITVFNLPPIDVSGTTGTNAYCAIRDTTYCGEGFAGPYLLYQERCNPNTFGMDQDNDGVVCDTLYFLVYDTTTHMWVPNPIFTDYKCGVSVHVDRWDFGPHPCEPQVKYRLDVKQQCLGSRQFACGIDFTLWTSNAFTQVTPGYYQCEFWLVDLDTVPPIIVCKEPAKTVTTSTDECAAHSYLSPLSAEDDWSGVKQVKATIRDVGTYLLTYDEDEDCYVSHEQVKLPKKEGPYYVVYEAYDSCHNVVIDSCMIYVKDRVKPVPVVDKGVTVSLSDKKVWVDASTFDEGSWDNCGVNLLLARRSDWYEACIDLCDSIDACWISEHHDTLWQALLQPDKHRDEVEAHYAKTLDWLCNDDVPCGDIIYNAWQYDLIKYATTQCREHPYEVGAHHIRKLIEEAWIEDELYKKFKHRDYIIGASSSGIVGPAGLGDLFKVDLETGKSTDIGAIPGSTEIEYDVKSGKLFSEGQDGDFILRQLDVGNASSIDIVAHDLGALNGMEYVDGKLYGTYIEGGGGNQPSTLVVVDPATGAFDKIGLTGFGPIPGLAYDDCHDILYGVDIHGILLEIDRNNGKAKELTPLPYNRIGSIEFGPDGKLYGALGKNSSRPGYLIEIDPVTGESELIGNTGHANFTGLAALEEGCVSEKLDIYEQIGGGWSEAVPFSCEDACGPVTVEVLVMDYWCNWATAWTKVWVEDKTPVEVVKDVVLEESITCKIYKDSRYAYPDEIHPVSLEYIVGQAKAGEQDAYDALDEIFGGYCKAWRDPYGSYVDADGKEIECDIPFYDSVCKCTSYYDQVRVYDEHQGYLWVDTLVTHCEYYQDTVDFQKGVIVVNCEENVYCEQDIWCDFDHCGQGYIFRKFKIWQGCPDEFYDEHGVADSLRHTVDTIYRHQRIWVGNECELNKYMFDVPKDTEVETCKIAYGPDGNVIGAAGPESTGYAKYKFDDDCRIVGIAHSDKVFKIVGGEAACYKILRTWYFADWCGYGEPLDGQWWKNRELVTDTCVQKIIVIDNTPPTCTITGHQVNGDTILSGGTVEVGACYFDLAVRVSAEDACGVIKYYWELKDVTDEDAVTVIDSDHGELSGDTTDAFDITSADIPHGSYKLVVAIQDDCANESYCEYYFDVVSVKKPSPVCVTSITATLTPWDSDQDGEVDSAHAVVWAEEFNSSSAEACNDTLLEYRIELIDGIDDDTWAEDTSYIELGCADARSHMARLWVISHPSGTVDFCNVVLLVASNSEFCGGTVGGQPGLISQVNDMHDVVEHQQKSRLGGEPTEPGIGGRPLGSTLAPTGFSLEQNRPNPFREETTIGFALPEAMEATLTVYDVTGRVLRSIRGDYSKGYQTIQLQKANLAGHSILYYRLDAVNFSATKKMILLD